MYCSLSCFWYPIYYRSLMILSSNWLLFTSCSSNHVMPSFGRLSTLIQPINSSSPMSADLTMPFATLSLASLAWRISRFPLHYCSRTLTFKETISHLTWRNRAGILRAILFISLWTRIMKPRRLWSGRTSSLNSLRRLLAIPTRCKKEQYQFRRLFAVFHELNPLSTYLNSAS